MGIDIFENEMKSLFAEDAELIRIAKGFLFTEGPVWDPIEGLLYFSDIPANTIYSYSPSGFVKTYRKPSQYSNGLVLDAQGKLLACEHRTRRVTRTSSGGTEVIADSYKGKRLNSPNDLIVASDGSIIFTDPLYGLRKELGGLGDEQELSFQGVFRVKSDGSGITLLADDFEAPNGLALSADERYLYIIDTIRMHIRRFTVGENWNLSGGDVFVELKGDGEGKPDGMKLDDEGRIYSTGPGGVWVCSPEGDILGRIRVPEKTANLAWGDTKETLYVTASTSVYKISVSV